MIDLERGEIVLGEKRYRIVEFSVWWITPFGLTQTIHQAKEILEKNEIPMNLGAKPIPIAVAEGGVIYEPFLSST